MKQTIRCSFQIFLCSCSILSVSGEILLAQVVRDNTVNTQVNRDGNVAEITGGETRGENLFHSFQDFSIPTGNEAVFNNANDIANIFSRVTGANVSNVDGIIRANGNANLFLINPAGIIFNENASLDIGGSFYGSTASSIVFDDGEFSAIAPESESILTVSVPIGLRFEDNPGDIVNNSMVNDRNGLEVAAGNDISLIGGNVSFNRGTVFAPNGTINLGGLTAAGTVNIDNDGSLTFPNDVAKAELALGNASIVNVVGTGEGNVNINASNFDLTAGEFGSSFIRAGVASESTNVQTGNITIDVVDYIAIDNSFIYNEVNSEATGNAGNINIAAGSLSIVNGGQIGASTIGRGNTGSIELIIEDTISVSGQISEGFPSIIGSTVKPGAEGNAGDVKITTNSLSLTNGGQIDAGTSGIGNAGSVEILAEDTISIDARNTVNFPSGIGSQVAPGAEGNAGSVEITTNFLSLTNGGTINASTFGIGNAGSVEILAEDIISIDGQNSEGFASGAGSQVGPGARGNAGDVKITTDSLSLTNGGLVDSSTFGIGNAGSVEILAENTISIDGQNPEGSPSGVGSVAIAEAEGNAGDIKITTNSLNLTNGGLVSASAEGQSNAGELTIKANFLSLDNARIKSSTTFGAGGIVNLQVADRIILENNSSISAQAFSNANGGNLSIDVGVIVAFPNQNNDLIASAEQGVGGNINITSKGVFGFERQNSNSSSNSNNIIATSKFSLDGTVVINTPDINLQQELEQSELEILTAERAIANSCLARSSQQVSFTINDNDGLPKNPNSNYSDTNHSLTGIGSLPTTEKRATEIQGNGWQQRYSTLPAQRMIEAKDGRIFLVAAPQKVESVYCQDASNAGK